MVDSQGTTSPDVCSICKEYYSAASSNATRVVEHEYFSRGCTQNETKKYTVSSSTLRERAYFVSGMLVKRITRAVKECKI